MNAALLVVAASVIGIDVGWEPIVDGSDEVEYVIQVEPQLLDTLKAGKDLVSELPAELKIRRYRITVGTGQLPRDPSLDKLRAAVQLKETRISEEQVEQEIPFHARGAPTPAEPARAADPPAGRADEQRPTAADIAEAEREAREHEQEREIREHEAREQEREREREREEREREALVREEKAREASRETPPVEPKPIVDNRPTDAEHEGGSHLKSGAQLFQPVPGEFDPKSRPLDGQPVNYDETSKKERVGQQTEGRKPRSASTAKPATSAGDAKEKVAEKSEPPKPWGTLVCAVTLLLASVGGNFYLGWIAWGERIRSRGLLEKLHAAASGS